MAGGAGGTEHIYHKSHSKTKHSTVLRAVSPTSTNICSEGSLLLSKENSKIPMLVWPGPMVQPCPAHLLLLQLLLQLLKLLLALLHVLLQGLDFCLPGVHVRLNLLELFL